MALFFLLFIFIRTYFVNGVVKKLNESSYENAYRFIDTSNMQKPIIKRGNYNYYLLYEQGDNRLHLYNNSGLVSIKKFEKKIRDIDIAKNLYVAILSYDDKYSYVDILDKNLIKISNTKTYDLAKNGEAKEIKINSDGSEYIVDLLLLKDNEINSIAEYVNIDNTSQTITSELSDKYLARIAYFDDEYSLLLYDMGAYFVKYGYKNDIKTHSILKHIMFNEKMSKIYVNKNYIAVLFENNRLMIISKKGKTIINEILR